VATESTLQEGGSVTTSRPRRTRNVTSYSQGGEDEDDPIEDSSDFDMESPRSSGAEDEGEANDNTDDNALSLDIEEEEEKPKPVLQLKYRGFSVLAFCLCIVVEPWPRLPQAPRAASIFRATHAPSADARALSVTPLPPEQRAKTPLFLPDDYDRDRNTTPAPQPGRELPPVPLFQDAIAMESSDEEDEDGLSRMNYNVDTIMLCQSLVGSLFF
jgi:hypothetical protein